MIVGKVLLLIISFGLALYVQIWIQRNGYPPKLLARLMAFATGFLCVFSLILLGGKSPNIFYLILTTCFGGLAFAFAIPRRLYLHEKGVREWGRNRNTNPPKV